MLRRAMLLGLVAGLVWAAGSSAAVAQVIVENPGHHEAESELSWGFWAHVPGVGEVPVLRCDNDWEFDVAANGDLQLFAENILPHPGQAGNCGTMEPCNGHAAWDGQFEEAAPGVFSIHWVFCLEGTGSALDGVSIPIECAFDDALAEAHCDAPIGGGIEVMGEVQLHESLGLLHG
jgi:hypothetical protein